MNPRGAFSSGHSGGSQRGISIIECLVYISVYTLITGLALAAFYRCWENTRRLGACADDIARTLKAGERWRADVRQATAAVRLESGPDAQLLRIPQKSGEVQYRFTGRTLTRIRQPDGRQHLLLTNALRSDMRLDPRTAVTAWRWEIELAPRAQTVRLKPLFTFLAVPATGGTP